MKLKIPFQTGNRRKKRDFISPLVFFCVVEKDGNAIVKDSDETRGTWLREPVGTGPAVATDAAGAAADAGDAERRGGVSGGRSGAERVRSAGAARPAAQGGAVPQEQHAAGHGDGEEPRGGGALDSEGAAAEGHGGLSHGRLAHAALGGRRRGAP